MNISLAGSRPRSAAKSPGCGAGIVNHGAISKLALCLVAGLIGGNAAIEQPARAKVDVQTQFLIQVVRELVSA